MTTYMELTWANKIFWKLKFNVYKLSICSRFKIKINFLLNYLKMLRKQVALNLIITIHYDIHKYLVIFSFMVYIFVVIDTNV